MAVHVRACRWYLCLSLVLVAGGALDAAIPAEVSALVAARKYDDACRTIYGLLPTVSGNDRLELIRLAYDNDPDLERLKSRLREVLGEAMDGGNHAAIAGMLGQLALSQRDFQTAQWAYSLLTEDPDARLRSAGLLLMLGRRDEARQGLIALLGQTKDSSVIERSTCLLAWLVWSDGQGKTALEILAGRKTAAAWYLTSVVSRSLGLKKEDQAARDRLAKEWPHSVWAALAEPDADPAIQIDTTLMILTGIGVSAAGDAMPGIVGPSQSGSAAKSSAADDSPAKAIQVGYFKDAKNARKLADSLNAKGFMAQVEDDKASQRLKVMVLIRPGQDPETLVLQLKDIGLEGFLVF